MVCVTGNRKTSFIQQVRIITASVMTDFTRTFAYVARLIQIMSTDFYCFEFHVKLYASHYALTWSIWKCKDLKTIFMLSGLFGKKRSVSENNEICGNKINDFPQRELSFSVMVIWFYDFSASRERKKETKRIWSLSNTSSSLFEAKSIRATFDKSSLKKVQKFRFWKHATFNQRRMFLFTDSQLILSSVHRN